mmetsp:Transcript_21323/g.63899  ORF Transcript_21323/g.63899 Transcript_21323/m.63899 type:complete len:202 (-) Transcript_21323:701-1306(-)
MRPRARQARCVARGGGLAHPRGGRRARRGRRHPHRGTDGRAAGRVDGRGDGAVRRVCGRRRGHSVCGRVGERGGDGAAVHARREGCSPAQDGQHARGRWQDTHDAAGAAGEDGLQTGCVPSVAAGCVDPGNGNGAGGPQGRRAAGTAAAWQLCRHPGGGWVPGVFCRGGTVCFVVPRGGGCRDGDWICSHRRRCSRRHFWK